MQHIEPPCSSVGIQTPLLPRVRVQVVKSNGQAFSACISRVMANLKAADRAVGVE